LVDHDTIRRIALALPDVTEATDGLAWSVLNRGQQKGIAWFWNERVEPRKPRVPNLGVLAVRVGAHEKEALLASDGETFFTEPHYNGFPAVLVRLAAIEADELAELLTDAWRGLAPKALVRAFDARTSEG
jgi:hypothetical protein